MSPLLIGWAEIDTTPDGKVDLSGQYYHRVSKGIHSRLSATVLALESADKEQVVMVSLDLVGFESTFLEQLRDVTGFFVPDEMRENSSEEEDWSCRRRGISQSRW